ncbi:MAG: hypothetical protein Q8R26_00290 [bacterium]|nr:hypothetical protein [bacterium]
MTSEDLEKFKKDIQKIEDLSEYIPNKLGISEKEKKAAIMVFWFVYLIEDIFKKMLNKLRSADYDENKFNELTLGKKINKIEQGCKKEGSYKDKSEFFQIARKIKKIRNDIVHQNKSINEVFYGDRSIIERETQEQMIIDFYSSTDSKS